MHPFRYQDEHLWRTNAKKSLSNPQKKRSEERFFLVLEQDQCLTTGVFDLSSAEATAGSGAASSSVRGTG